MKQKKLIFKYFMFVLTILLSLSSCEITQEENTLPPIEEGKTSLVLIVHGLGDSPELWPEEMKNAIESRMGNNPKWQIATYDWSEHSKNFLTASTNGLEIGSQLGEELAARDYDAIHMISHSVGSFLINGAARSYLTLSESPAYIHMTFLDPFTLHGVVGIFYGVRYFGLGSDFCER